MPSIFFARRSHPKKLFCKKSIFFVVFFGN